VANDGSKYKIKQRSMAINIKRVSISANKFYFMNIHIHNINSGGLMILS